MNTPAETVTIFIFLTEGGCAYFGGTQEEAETAARRSILRTWHADPSTRAHEGGDLSALMAAGQHLKLVGPRKAVITFVERSVTPEEDVEEMLGVLLDARPVVAA